MGEAAADREQRARGGEVFTSDHEMPGGYNVWRRVDDHVGERALRYFSDDVCQPTCID